MVAYRARKRFQPLRAAQLALTHGFQNAAQGLLTDVLEQLRIPAAASQFPIQQLAEINSKVLRCGRIVPAEALEIFVIKFEADHFVNSSSWTIQGHWCCQTQVLENDGAARLRLTHRLLQLSEWLVMLM